MLSVVCFKWNTPGYRSQFAAEHVNVLRRMVARNYSDEHIFFCVTDDPAGIDAGTKIVPLWDDHADLPSPHGPNNPSCFRRLKLFAWDASATFGERIVCIDLDCVITGDLRPLWNRPEDFVAWRDPMHPHQYNGSMMLLRTGSRPQVWKDFDPATSPRIARAARFSGSDQAWISYCLPGEATWSKSDGVYSYSVDRLYEALPTNARVAVFHGKVDPWHPEAQRLAWVRENWRITERKPNVLVAQA